MNWFYVAIGLGIVMWLTVTFQVLLGMRIIKLSNGLHTKVHRWIGFALVGLGLLHGLLALGVLVFGWF